MDDYINYQKSLCDSEEFNFEDREVDKDTEEEDRKWGLVSEEVHFVSSSAAS